MIYTYNQEESLKDNILRFHKEWYKPRSETGLTPKGITKVSFNGEISFDNSKSEYVVYEETYAYEVGRTCYPLVALEMLKTYGKEYLQ